MKRVLSTIGIALLVGAVIALVLSLIDVSSRKHYVGADYLPRDLAIEVVVRHPANNTFTTIPDTDEVLVLYNFSTKAEYPELNLVSTKSSNYLLAVLPSIVLIIVALPFLYLGFASYFQRKEENIDLLSIDYNSYSKHNHEHLS